MQKNTTQKATMINDMTTGSVPGRLIRFAAPFVLANCLQFVYNLVDMIIVGQCVGSSGLSAVSIGGEFMHFVTYLGMSFSQAGQVVIAQYVGKGDRGAISRVIGTMFTFIIGMGVVASVLSVVFARDFALLLNTPAESFEQAVSYCVVCGCGMVFVYGYNTVSNIMRGMGDSKRPLLFIGIAAVVNLVLDLLFVAVLDMNATGAALATVIGQSLSFIISLIYLYRRREAFGFDFKLKSFAIDRRILVTITKLGIPICLQTVAVSVSMMYVTACINVYGVIYSAVTGISSKISQLCNIITMSLNAAGSTMIGQNFGAGKNDRVSRVYWVVLLIGGIFASVMTALLLCFPKWTFMLFNSDPAVLAVCAEMIPVIILNFYSAASRAPSSALINGIGFAGMNFIMGIMDGVVVRIGLALLLGGVLGLGVHGYWYGNAIAGYMYFFVILPYFLSGRWKKRRPVV